jgi:hypothetical protein
MTVRRLELAEMELDALCRWSLSRVQGKNGHPPLRNTDIDPI